MNKKLFDKVSNLIAKEMNIDIEKIKEKSDFVNDLGCDSLDTVELVMKVEETFGISITDMDAEKIKTVGELVDYIEGATK